jgi:conjugative transfer signal peptidase TraF
MSRSGRLGLVAAGLLLVGVTAVVGRASSPHILWNATPSLPEGIYSLHYDGAVAEGSLVWVELPNELAELARSRNYIPPQGHLLKHVVASEGSTWCATDRFVVDGRDLGPVHSLDSYGRPLPALNRCGVVPSGHVLVGAPHPRSFDSRYIGPVSVDRILATGRPLWISSH